MTKYTTGALVVATVLFAMQVSVRAQGCEDNYIKEMIVRVCGMEGYRRSLSYNDDAGSMFSNFGGSSGDIQHKFQSLVREADAILKNPNNNNQKADAAGNSMVVKQGILDEFKKCCVKKNCSVKDFNSLCAKK